MKMISLARWKLIRNVTTSLALPWMLGLSATVFAGEVTVEFVELEQVNRSWTAHVTVRHGDTGWEHYADAWRILDHQDKVLGKRTLYHPHETEQPFTRSLSGVVLPVTAERIKVQAHDKVHGWGEAVVIDLQRQVGPKHRIRRGN